MTRYLLTNAEHNTWRGSRVSPGRSVISSKSEDNVIDRNTDELGESPLVAIMLNPWHAQIDQQKMLELEIGQVEVINNDTCINMTVREASVPSVTTDQKIVFALMVMQEVYKNPVFNNWADSWISGSDRSPESAGKMFAHLGQIAREAGSSPGDANNGDFCSRASEAIFAAQIYMDRTENWPLLASRSVSRAVGGLHHRTDLTAIAERAVASSAKGVMRSSSAA
jgi:hypothetical protein